VRVLTTYINASLRKAHHEILLDGEGYFGSIEGFQGVWAQGDTLEACREEFREVLEEWIALGLRTGHPVYDHVGAPSTSNALGRARQASQFKP
jgi:predicted RNase H-like HicB family nuclease